MTKVYRMGICPVCGSEKTEHICDNGDYCQVKWDDVKECWYIPSTCNNCFTNYKEFYDLQFLYCDV